MDNDNILFINFDDESIDYITDNSDSLYIIKRGNDISELLTKEYFVAYINYDGLDEKIEYCWITTYVK